MSYPKEMKSRLATIYFITTKVIGNLRIRDSDWLPYWIFLRVIHSLSCPISISERKQIKAGDSICNGMQVIGILIIQQRLEQKGWSKLREGGEETRRGGDDEMSKW